MRWRTPSIHPKQSASSTDCGQLMLGRAGEEGCDRSGDAKGSEQADGAADERELRSGSEHEAGDVPDLGSQREADAEFAGALGDGASDDAVDAQGGQTEPEHGKEGKDP